MIYLDYQATSPLDSEVLEVMLPWLTEKHANPHSTHKLGREAAAAVEVARERIAQLLPSDGRVVFTSGATEALNWAIKGSDGPIVTLATEHAAVLDSAAATGRPMATMAVGEDGLVDLSAAEEAIRPSAGLVAAMLVNNEIGVIQPVEKLARFAHDVGALFLCDAVQGYGRVSIPLHCDLIALSAHKIYGPKGIGALWVRNGVELPVFMHGGGQEPLGRSGTLSPALCVGFGVAASLMLARGPIDDAPIKTLFAAALRGLGPNWIVNGSKTERYHGNLNVRLDGLDASRLISECRDLAISAGSACASGSGRPSHVLKAIGLSDAEARSSLRLGFGRFTTQSEIETATQMINAAARAQGLEV